MTVDKKTLNLLRKEFVGKRVCVENKDGVFCGKCVFIGYNEYLPSFGFQVTVDRTPVTNVEIRNIRLSEDLKMF